MSEVSHSKEIPVRRTYTWAMALVATLVLGLVGAVPASAVDTYTVSVKVTTSAGTGVPGVSLSLDYDVAPYGADASTDGTGVATFTNIPAGTVSLSGYVSVGSSYKTISQDITVPTTSATVVKLAGTQAFVGKVTDKATGAGIAGVDIAAYGWSSNTYGGSATTTSSGAYALLVGAGSYRVSFYPPSSSTYLTSYYPNTTNYSSAKAVTVASGKDTTGINAALLKPGKITGKVTYGGKAVKGASVFESAVDFWGPSTTTSASGTYSASINPGSYAVGVERNTTSPFLTTYYGGTVRQPDAKKVTVGSGASVTGINITPKAGATLKGVVKDSKGKAVKGAYVSAYNTTRSGGSSAKTNAKGAYVLYGLASGNVFVSASDAKGVKYGTKNVTATQGKTKTVKTIVIKSAGTSTIKGTFKVKSDKVTNTWAVLLNSKKLQVGGVTPTKKGAVTFKNLAAGTYTVVFSGTNISKKVTVKAKKTASFGTLTRPKLTTLKGTVKKPNGKVAANVSVSLYDSFGTSAGYAQTNSKGAYSIKGLVKGKYTVSAYDYTNTYVPVSVKFTAKSGKNVTKALKLKTGGTLKGVVKNSKGKAVAGVNVWADGAYATTNAKGAYVLKGVAAGKTTVTFSDPYVGGYHNATKKATAKAGKTVTVATIKVK